MLWAYRFSSKKETRDGNIILLKQRSPLGAAFYSAFTNCYYCASLPKEDQRRNNINMRNLCLSYAITASGVAQSIISPDISIFGFDMLVDAWQKKDAMRGILGLLWAGMNFSWKVVVFIPKIIQCLVYAAELALWQYYDKTENYAALRYAAAIFALIFGVVHIVLRQIFSPEEAAVHARQTAAAWELSERWQTAFFVISLAVSLMLNLLLAKIIILPAVALLVAVGIPTLIVSIIVGGPLYVISHYVPQVASFFNMLGGLLKNITGSIGIGQAVKVTPQIQAGLNHSSTALMMNTMQVVAAKGVKRVSVVVQAGQKKSAQAVAQPVEEQSVEQSVAPPVEQQPRTPNDNDLPDQSFSLSNPDESQAPGTGEYNEVDYVSIDGAKGASLAPGA